MPKTPRFYLYRYRNTECQGYGCWRLKKKGRRRMCRICRKKFLQKVWSTPQADEFLMGS